MADYLAPKLSSKVIPLVRDCDRLITLRRKDSSGDPADWDGQVSMLIDRRGYPEQIDAVLAGPHATIRIEANSANQCKTGGTWRIIWSRDGSPSFEIPLMVGTFERNDG